MLSVSSEDESGAPTPAPLGVESANAAPQFEQKRIPSGFSLPHLKQTTIANSFKLIQATKMKVKLTRFSCETRILTQ
jgi:hypothetical protein